MWFLYALLGALGATVESILKKYELRKERIMDFLFLHWGILAIVMLLFIPFVDFSLSPGLIFLIFFRCTLFITGMFFLTKAIQEMEVSEVNPFLNLQPFLVLILAVFFLSEVVSYFQVIGIITLMIGTYVLELDSKKGLLYPLKRLISSNYIHHVLLAVCFFSVAAIMAKIFSNTMSEITMLFYFIMFEFIMVAFVYFLFFGGIKGVKQAAKSSNYLIFVIAGVSLFSVFFYFKALSMANVSLVLPVYRLSSLFSVIAGGRLFHEHHMFSRAAASVFMVLGIVLLAVH